MVVSRYSQYPVAPSRKDEQYYEYYQAFDWVTHGIIYSFLVSVLLSFIAMPLGHLVEQGFSAKSWGTVKNFYAYVADHPTYFIKAILNGCKILRPIRSGILQSGYRHCLCCLL